MARVDLKVKFRRSYLGPLWSPIQSTILILALGYIYSGILSTPQDSYFIFIASGIISWNHFSTTIVEMSNSLIDSEALLRNVRLSYITYFYRTFFRNFMTYIINFTVALLIIKIIFRSHEILWIQLFISIPIFQFVIFLTG